MKNKKRISARQSDEANDLKICYFDLSGKAKAPKDYAARIRDIIDCLMNPDHAPKQSNESIKFLIFLKTTRNDHE